MNSTLSAPMALRLYPNLMSFIIRSLHDIAESRNALLSGLAHALLNESTDNIES